MNLQDFSIPVFLIFKRDFTANMVVLQDQDIQPGIRSGTDVDRNSCTINCLFQNGLNGEVVVFLQKDEPPLTGCM
jgi:hypothetical protein